MNKGEFLTLFNNLNTLGGLKGVNFSYAVAKNLNHMKNEVEAIQKTIEETEVFVEFNTKRVALAEEHSEKGKDGKPVTEGTEYVLADEAAFEKAFKKLQKEYKEAIDARDTQVEDYKKLLDEEVTDFKPHMIKLAKVPEEISTQQMAQIFEIVEE